MASAKSAFIPDVTAYASDTWQNGLAVSSLPTSARLEFGSITMCLISVRDVLPLGSAKRSSAEAEENLKRLKDSISAQVERNYNALERTKNLVAVADQVVALRRENERLSKNQRD